MLEPNKHRFDYGEQLNAPAGFELDAAIATTYSLDLSALLMISVALGFKDTLEGDLSGEKLVILEAISGLKDKLKVFYQKGKITVPTEYNSLFTLLEPCVCPVIPEGGEFSSFHPKVWLLRYVESEKKRNQKIRYKLIVLTRNLTFDKSWDVAASLDGTLMDEVQTKDSQNGWIDFFLSLLEHEKDFLPTKVLTNELPYIKWKMFKSAWSEKLLPGGGRFGQPLFFNKFDHILVVSPFIKDAGGQIKALNWLAEQVPADADKLLFSREEELNAVGEDALRDWQCFAINPGVVGGEEKIEEGSELHNLHAKLIVTERGNVTDWHIGSANATSAALGNKRGESPRNSEFMLRFSGPTELFGRDSLLEQWIGVEEGRGLFVPHVFETVDDIDNIEERNTLRSIIYELIKAKWDLIATLEHPDINYTLTLKVESDVLFEKMEKNNITIQVDQLAIQGAKKRLEQIMLWSNVELTQISAFLPIYISLPNKEEEEKVVIQVPLKLEGGDIRHQGILKKMLDSNEKILNYIRMLLNPEADKNEWLEYDGNKEIGVNREIDIFATDTPLFEQLMYTASRHPEALERIESLINNLENSDIEIPKEFSALWEHFRIGLESND